MENALRLFVAGPHCDIRGGGPAGGRAGHHARRLSDQLLCRPCRHPRWPPWVLPSWRFASSTSCSIPSSAWRWITRGRGSASSAPWLAAAVPVLIVSTFAVYFPGSGVGTLYLIGWLLVLYAGYSMLTLSQSGWGAVLVSEYHQRSRVYGWIQAMAVVGAIGVLLLPAFLPALWKTIPAQGRAADGRLRAGLGRDRRRHHGLFRSRAGKGPRRNRALRHEGLSAPDPAAGNAAPDHCRSFLHPGPGDHGADLSFLLRAGARLHPAQTYYLLLLYIVSGSHRARRLVARRPRLRQAPDDPHLQRLLCDRAVDTGLAALGASTGDVVRDVRGRLYRQRLCLPGARNDPPMSATRCGWRPARTAPRCSMPS